MSAPSIPARQGPTYILPEPSKPTVTQSQKQAFISIQGLKNQRKRIRRSRIRLFSDPDNSNNSSDNSPSTPTTKTIITTNINDQINISPIKEQEEPLLPQPPSIQEDTNTVTSQDIEEYMKDWLPIATGQTPNQQVLERQAKSYLEMPAPPKPKKIIILRKLL